MRFHTSIANYCHILGLVEVRVFHPILPSSDTESDVDSADFGRSHVNGSVERRLCLTNSSPNVKALFDNSPVTYSYSIEDDDDSTYMTPQSDYWHHLPPPIVRPSVCSCSVRPLITSLKGIWNPWPRETPGRCDQAWVDSLLESKLKDHLSKPRALSNRAQSLDLTFSSSKITEASRYPPPDSPTTLIGDTGPTSTPPSVTAPSFPSVYGPPKANRSPVMSSRSHRPQYVDDGVDDVTRVIRSRALAVVYHVLANRVPHLKWDLKKDRRARERTEGRVAT